MTNRRDFLRRLGGLTVAGTALLAVRADGQQGELAGQGQGDAGALRDPGSAGRPQERKTARDNDEFVTAVEHRLQCTCGCTLDIYTCRTTDFTCTYSPELHKEVLALKDQGKTADEIVAAFVAKYGEKVLMAPKPEGFNLAGYVVPGIGILAAAGIMTLILKRRTAVRAAAAGAAAVPSLANTMAGPVPTAGATTKTPTQDELERLQRELKEFDG